MPNFQQKQDIKKHLDKGNWYWDEITNEPTDDFKADKAVMHLGKQRFSMPSIEAALKLIDIQKGMQAPAIARLVSAELAKGRIARFWPELNDSYVFRVY